MIVVCSVYLDTSAEVLFSATVFDSGSSGLFAIADFDNDTRNDIAVAGGRYPLFWLRSPGWEPFPIVKSGDYGMEIQAGDVDRDGDTDILTPDTKNSVVVWFENPGNGAGTWRRHDIGAWNSGYPHDFKIGDINGDGKIDAVVCPNQKSPFYLFIQEQPDRWIAREIGNSEFEGTWVADIDNDGDDDITCGKFWFESPGKSIYSPWKTHRINTWTWPKRRVNVRHINDDWRVDIITTTAEFGSGSLAWYEAPVDPAEGEWIEHELLPPKDYNFHTLQIGDIDLDGTNDIVVGATHYLGQDDGYWIRIFYNTDGTGLLWDEQKWRTEKGIWQGVLGDVGSDGDLDIVGANYTSNSFQELWENRLNPPSTSIRPCSITGHSRLQETVYLCITGAPKLRGRNHSLQIQIGTDGAWSLLGRKIDRYHTPHIYTRGESSYSVDPNTVN
jgi:hypothetical protein